MSTNINEKFVISGESDENYDIDKRGIGAFIFDAFEKHGQEIFQILVEDGTSETYASFKARSTRLAIALTNIGITKDDIVAVSSSNTLDSYLPIIASLFIGAKATSFEPLLSKDEQKYLINIAKPKVIFTQRKWFNKIEECLTENINVTIIVMEDTVFQNMIKEKENEEKFKPIITDCRETAFIFYSSGSTSLPKGIEVSHFSLLYSIENQLNNGYSKQYGILSVDNPYWAIAFTDILIAIKTGGYRVVIDVKHYSNVDYLLDAIAKYKVTYALISASTTINIISQNLDKYDLTSFEIMIVAGSKLSSENLANTRKKLPHTFIAYVYGQTEVLHVSQFHKIRDWQLYLRKPGSVGKLVTGVSAKIVDIKTNVALGPNQQGELRIKTPCIMNGYYRNSESTLDEFGYHKTGDIAYYDEDECFYIVRRTSEMFKFGDWAIVPFFLEQCIMKHEAVKEAVVFGTPHISGEMPSALVALNNGYTIKEEKLLEFSNKQLSTKDKLVGGLKIVEELPKTCTHKVIRSKARKIFLDMIDDK